MSVPIRLIVAANQRLLRQCLCCLLEQDPEICVIAEAADGQETVTLAMEQSFDVILMDFGRSLLDGLQAIQTIMERDRRVRILVLTADQDDARTIQALYVGAVGSIVKDTDHRELIAIVKGVARIPQMN